MAEAAAFNLTDGQEAERKLLVTAVNVGTSAAPEWEIVGVGVEDSAVEYNPDVETLTDILAITHTKVNKLETSQTLEPMTIRGGSDLQIKLYNQIKYKRYSELSMYEVLLIHAYVGTAGSYEAEKHTGCTITPTSIGGSSYADMPITINFSNNKVHGTVNAYAYGSTITFTPAA
jgi:hypothetical protein